MFARFDRDAGSLLGVEITSGSVRMLHARRQAGRCRVVGWACVELDPPGAGGPAALVQSLIQAHRRCATRQRQVAVSLPASQVICKLCQIPRETSAQDMEAKLLVEADQLFPFPLDDLALDFQVMRPSPSAPDALEVLVAACRQSQLDPLEQLFARAGLELVALEVDSFALLRVVGPLSPARVVVVQLEVDEVVVHRWGADQLPLRQQLPLPEPAQWREAVMSLLQSCDAPVDEVVLAGAAADAMAASGLSEYLGGACRLVEMTSPPAPAVSPDASMALAYGLALGGLR